jgi:hypothetical protein
MRVTAADGPKEGGFLDSDDGVGRADSPPARGEGTAREETGRNMRRSS